MGVPLTPLPSGDFSFQCKVGTIWIISLSLCRWTLMSCASLPVSTAPSPTCRPSSCWPTVAGTSRWSSPWWTTETSPSTPLKTSSCPRTSTHNPLLLWKQLRTLDLTGRWKIKCIEPKFDVKMFRCWGFGGGSHQRRFCTISTRYFNDIYDKHIFIFFTCQIEQPDSEYVAPSCGVKVSRYYYFSLWKVAFFQVVSPKYRYLSLWFYTADATQNFTPPRIVSTNL